MKPPPSLEDGELDECYFAEGYHIKALEITEDYILEQSKGSDIDFLDFQQGAIFKAQSRRTDNPDVKFTFLLGSVECFSRNEGFSSFCAVSLFELGNQLGSPLYYKKSVKKAKEYLSILASFRQLSLKEQKSQKDIQSLLKDAESRIAESKTVVGSPMNKCEAQVRELKKNTDLRKDEVQRLRSFWMGLDSEFKRNFMKVSIAELTGYVQDIFGTEGENALEQFLTYARGNRKWRFWMCRTCSKKISSCDECKNHLEQEHAAEFKPTSTKDMAQRISKVWANKILVGVWEPVDVVAATEMIKNRLQDVKAFVYENGWSKEWPLDVDEERRKLLQEIKLLLVLFWERKILSCSIRDWMLQFPVKHLAQFEVSEHTLTSECRLTETPQSICFLESDELTQILEFLKKIKCERDDGTDLVRRAVDSFCGDTRVKEKIDFDPQFSFLLLDKRLLKCKITRYDDDMTINVIDPSVHYAKVEAHGDDILSWLAYYSSGDESSRFPRPIRTYNLDIWVAVLRAVQFTCRTLQTKYAKKLQMICYDAALIDAKNVCILEDEKRKNIPDDQRNIYASLLCDKCEEHLSRDAGNSLNTKLFLCAVRDVLKEASYPTFEFRNQQDCLNLLIHGYNHISNDIVLKSIDHLKSVVTNKVLLIDSKILLVANSRTKLLDDLVKLSAFDYRSYILQTLKRFLQKELEDMNTKAKSAAVEAELLSQEKQEKEKKSDSKKKKHRSKKRTSTSRSSRLDQNVQHDTYKPEDTLSSQRGPLEISSKTEGQEEATKDMQSMPGEDSLEKHLESGHEKVATKYNSALDMMLKSLFNIEVLKDDLVRNPQPFSEEQVPSALRELFSAFVSEKINEEGRYSYLLSNLLASLEEVHSLSSDAAEVVVTILEFLHCWKSPERESLVTRLFTLEEYERMSCQGCRRKPNYPEQSSYGIFMAADSIRDLKCAFGNIKFVDILKIIRMEAEMLCDITSGGCGMTNSAHHIISRCPPIFTIVLEWEKNDTEKEMSETTKALDWEIDISRLYEGLEPNTKYRLVSMIGYGDEGEYICIAYKKNQWVSLRHKALAEEDVGNWKSVVQFCGERKIQLKILFYEAVQWPTK